MYTIHLICTSHADNGMCNSIELFKLFKQIEPEVIFEELPPSFYEKFYIEKSHSNLETNAIKMYLEASEIKQVQVDSDDIPNETFFHNYKKLISKVEGRTNINGFNFRRLIYQKKIYTNLYGFNFINSDNCMEINNGIYEAIENEVQQLKDKDLDEILSCWKNVNEKRENFMLQNIYDFSKNHQYKKAIFMIGHAHRKSIISKIQNYNESHEIRLNWVY
ncbi:hypothetical protein KIH23_10070 [Flavobacterium sp. CYK-55]|uniref:hypothetical protein n=1 Tax=Flavobacterium sp. CYK-55 TaxID=2835529 RepID=UPI001BCF869E|nr:hypothetical protein [Flavobacterium sp. CYK-55]MBS7787643.1 hypothetical protein [Flavobacterium sp. CYK-55]